MRIAFTAGMIGVAFAAMAPMAARADDCGIVMAAALAQAKTPYAGAMTMSEPGKPPNRNAVISTGTKMYVQVEGGAWQSMDYNPQEMIDLMNENLKKSTQTCQKSGSESVNGEAATVYTQHSDNGKVVADSRIWISDRRGLPLKLETHFKDGMSLVQETHYDNVQAPAGVK
jgi:outer membrane lipoprotein-sorting protein